MILDTNALSAFLDEDAGLLEMLGTTRALHLPAIVLGEFRFGLRNSRKKRTLIPILDALEADCVVLAVDSLTAREYADVRSELRVAGKPIPSTTGVEWRFIRFENNMILWDQQTYTLGNLPELLGVLQYVIDETKFYASRKN